MILSDDNIAKIGEYLVFPQMELGFMNRRLHYVFFKYVPLKPLCACFGIPELMDSTYSQDLITLTRLSHVQELIYFAFSISMALCRIRFSTFNKKALLRYFYRIFSSLPNEIWLHLLSQIMIDRYKLCFAIRFMNEEDYENAISISKLVQTLPKQCSINITNLSKFINSLSSLWNQMHEDYKLILRSISGNRLKNKLPNRQHFRKRPDIILCPRTLHVLDRFEKVITQICTDIFIFPIDFDIFCVLSELLDIERARNVTVDQNIFNYIQLMIRIRFGTESHEAIQNEIMNNDYASNLKGLQNLHWRRRVMLTKLI